MPNNQSSWSVWQNQPIPSHNKPQIEYIMLAMCCIKLVKPEMNWDNTYKASESCACIILLPSASRIWLVDDKTLSAIWDNRKLYSNSASSEAADGVEYRVEFYHMLKHDLHQSLHSNTVDSRHQASIFCAIYRQVIGMRSNFEFDGRVFTYS